MGIFLCSISVLLIEALLYHEECHSKRSPSFTTTPELDCSIWIIQYVFSLTDASEMRSSTHSLLSYRNFVFCQRETQVQVT